VREVDREAIDFLVDEGIRADGMRG